MDCRSELPSNLSPHLALLFMVNHLGTDVSDFIAIKELARRLGVTEKAIRRKMERGVLIRGTHWFRARGFRTIFSWRAIEESIRNQCGPYGQASASPKDAWDGLHGR